MREVPRHALDSSLEERLKDGLRVMQTNTTSSDAIPSDHSVLPRLDTSYLYTVPPMAAVNAVGEWVGAEACTDRAGWIRLAPGQWLSPDAHAPVSTVSPARGAVGVLPLASSGTAVGVSGIDMVVERDWLVVD